MMRATAAIKLGGALIFWGWLGCLIIRQWAS